MGFRILGLSFHVSGQEGIEGKGTTKFYIVDSSILPYSLSNDLVGSSR